MIPTVVKVLNLAGAVLFQANVVAVIVTKFNPVGALQSIPVPQFHPIEPGLDEEVACGIELIGLMPAGEYPRLKPVRGIICMLDLSQPTIFDQTQFTFTRPVVSPLPGGPAFPLDILEKTPAQAVILCNLSASTAKSSFNDAVAMELDRVRLAPGIGKEKGIAAPSETYYESLKEGDFC